MDYLLIIVMIIVILNFILTLFLFFQNQKQQNQPQDMANQLQQQLSILRNELNETISRFQQTVMVNINTSLNNEKTSQNEHINLLVNTVQSRISGVSESLDKNTALTESKLEAIRATLINSISHLQNENSKKLDEMREIVDEKLQKTLNDRLTQSFTAVTETLNSVHQSIGEVQSLAQGVGDLKKVLSGVKTRGILGEVQLRNILEQILSKEQYEENVSTKAQSSDRVEFAVKLPGDNNNNVYLPIDAKFPLDIYNKVTDAIEIGDIEQLKTARKGLEQAIKKAAKDIHEKYIDAPNTTDFGVMFLPIEGLYAEVVNSGITEIIQRDYKIVVSGPTTMAALLNSLQMGFKTLAIEKRSSEVWQTLEAVKTHFGQFKKVLLKTQNNLSKASGELADLVGKNTDRIIRKLNNVSSNMSLNDAEKILECDEMIVSDEDL